MIVITSLFVILKNKQNIIPSKLCLTSSWPSNTCKGQEKGGSLPQTSELKKNKWNRSCQFIKQACIKEFDGILMFFTWNLQSSCNLPWEEVRKVSSSRGLISSVLGSPPVCYRRKVCISDLSTVAQALKAGALVIFNYQKISGSKAVCTKPFQEFYKLWIRHVRNFWSQAFPFRGL